MDKALYIASVHWTQLAKSLALHPAGDVDRVVPRVIDEFMMANHPRDERATVDVDAYVERQVKVMSNPAQRGADFKGARAPRSVWYYIQEGWPTRSPSAGRTKIRKNKIARSQESHLFSG